MGDQEREVGVEVGVNARDGPGRTRLHALCGLSEFGETELGEVEELLDAGADPNLVDSFERAPLSLLCMNTGHVGAAKALLAAGVKSAAQDAWGR
jgi:ankyrin repeat protein